MRTREAPDVAILPRPARTPKHAWPMIAKAPDDRAADPSCAPDPSRAGAADATHKPVSLGALVSDTVVYGLAKIVDPALGFLLLPVMTTLLAPGDYGVVSLFTATANIAFVVFSMGVHQSFLRRYTEATTDDAKRLVLGGALAVTLLVWCTLAPPLLLAAGPLSRWLFDDPSPTLVCVLVAATLVQTLDSVAANRLQADGRAWTYFGTTVLASFFVRFLSLGLVLWGAGAWGWIAGESLARLAAFGVLAFCALRGTRLTLRPVVAGPLLWYGAALVPAMLSFYLMTTTDKYLIRALADHPFEQVGLYTVGERIAGIMHLANLAFVLGWQRFAFSNMHVGDGQDRIGQALRIYVVAAGYLAMALVVLGDDLTHWVISDRFDAGAVVIAPLTLAAFLGGVANTTDIGLHKANRPHHISLLNLAAAIFNVALNYWTIPRLGIFGAAVSTMIAQGARVSLLWLASQRAYPVRLEYRRLAAAAAVLVTTGLIASALDRFGWAVSSVGAVLLVLAAAPCLWWSGCLTPLERRAASGVVGSAWGRLFAAGTVASSAPSDAR